MKEIPQLEKKPGTALVLSGGATKAFYFHLGVLKVLQDERFTSIVGSSAGSIIGAFLATGISVDSLITSLYQKQVYLPRFDSWVKTVTSTMLFKPKYRAISRQSLFTGLSALRFIASLPRLHNKDLVAEAIDRLVTSQGNLNGFFDSFALEELFRSLLPSADFADTGIDLYITGTSLDTGKRAVFNGIYEFEVEDTEFMVDVPIHKAVRASSAVPGMFEPVKIKGQYYIDGEIKRTLSADIGVSLADRVIVSHTYQPLHMTNGDTIRDLGWLNILRQSGIMLFYERIARWREMYENAHQDKEIIWIQPDPDDLDFFLAPEFSFRQEVQKKLIKSGEAAALKVLNKHLS